MACNSNILSNIPASCDSSMGGILEVYITHRDSVSAVTVTDGKITAIELVTESPEKFHTFSVKRNTASVTSTYNIAPENGVNFVTTELSLVFTKQDTEKRVAITALALDDLAVIYKDANGLYWYMGKDEPVSATAAGAESGTNRTDGNKYTITLQDNSLQLPLEVDSKAITAVIE